MLKRSSSKGKSVTNFPTKKEHNDVANTLFYMLKSFVVKNELGYLGYDKTTYFEPDLYFFDKEKNRSIL